MGHRRIQIALGISALALAATTVAGCGSSSKSAATTTPTTAAASGGSSSAPATASMITIQNFAFHPSSLTVAPGAKVTVHNADGTTHTVTASGSNKGAFNTGDVQPNATTTFTAPTKPGSYSYICNIHQYMTGTLIVS